MSFLLPEWPCRDHVLSWHLGFKHWQLPGTQQFVFAFPSHQKNILSLYMQWFRQTWTSVPVTVYLFLTSLSFFFDTNFLISYLYIETLSGCKMQWVKNVSQWLFDVVSSWSTSMTKMQGRMGAFLKQHTGIRCAAMAAVNGLCKAKSHIQPGKKPLESRI